MLRRLPSGIRLAPPWPIQLLNKAGPLVKALGLWPRLEPNKMIAAAERQCKLSKWPEAHLRALPVRANAFNNDAKLSLFGALAVKDQFMRGLTNSLRFENFVEEHPEIRDEKITRPLFVLGLPRTGTTLLQRLLCMHDGARYLPFWEGYAPLPKVLGEGKDGSDGRIEGARRALSLMKWISPEMDKIHPLDVEDPEECYLIFRTYVLMPPGFDFSYLPSYWKWFSAQDHLDAYRLHKQQLQTYQWLNRREQWVLKCPNHLSGLQHLLKVYPDARIVYTHRDPLKVVPSLCSLAAVAWSMISDDVDLDEVVEFAMSMTQRCQEAGQAALETFPRDQIIHVEFDELVSDPVATALSIYDRFGYRRDPELKAKASKWLQENKSDKHGAHTYALSDFGLTGEEVRRRLKGVELVAAPAAE